MIDAAPIPNAPLVAAPLLSPDPGGVPDEPAAASSWRDDLRFFLTCYLCGLAVFLVMLS